MSLWVKKAKAETNRRYAVVDAINRQMAHYPYHIGQIIYIAKIIKSKTWKNLSIPKGASQEYNSGTGIKDPAKNFK